MNIYRFSKYHGAGNDFILIQDFEEVFPKEKVAFLCDRHFGIGADGLILAQESQIADFKMVYFNADGSQADLCGNGLRCFAHFLLDLGFEKGTYKVEIANQVLTVIANRSKISTFFPYPSILHWELELENRQWFVVKCGVPHAVIFEEGEVEVNEEGRKIRNHPLFGSEGVNVNFVQKSGENTFAVRTYERGVEGETQACGTAAVAVAFVANKLGKSRCHVKVITRSKECIEVNMGEEIEVIGPSLKVFDGSIMLLCPSK